MEITDDNVQIVEQNKTCSQLILRIKIDGEHNIEKEKLTQVKNQFFEISELFCWRSDFTFSFIFQSIENFLKSFDGEFIIEEYGKLQYLKRGTVTKLMDKLVHYIFKHYGLYPTSDSMIKVAAAAVDMFKLPGGVVRNIFLNICSSLL